MDKIGKREYEIIEVLREIGASSIKTIASRFTVSEMTIRRSIRKLEDLNIVKRIGGTIILQQVDLELSQNYQLSEVEKKFSDEKENISIAAAKLIEKGDVVFLDIGSTVVRLLKYLPDLESYTFVCCTNNVANELIKLGAKKIYLTGGTYLSGLELFESREGLEMLQSLRMNKSFMSAAGINSKFDVTCKQFSEKNYKRTAIKNAEKKYLMIDYHKFNKTSPVCFSTLTEFDTIITNKNLSKKWVDEIENLGIELILV